MTAFLLIVSFILNIIALLGIIILYTRQNRMLQFEKNQREAVKEMETILSSFAAEMKEDHENLLASLPTGKAAKKEKGNTPEPLPAGSPVNSGNKSGRSLPPSGQPYKKGKKKAITSYKDSKPPDEFGGAESLINQLPGDIVEISSASSQESAKSGNSFKAHFNKQLDGQAGAEQLYVNSILHQALELKKSGLSNEQIAKKLQKGKTEIDLLLKIRS
ncbi:hypothetical protein [Peribacillus deserti]|uniref:Swarming motility protein SwrB n=1 Tax=Peribacillus deserti TaxID=673318 RepID=A0A2N5MB56_9BACI|nr:hypothetical protein [Peribacillus deserti]PLT31573.1 hypothetical protein CUU66_01570 [Peribacillus deserti]